MKHQNNIDGVYVDISALLDFRLAVLSEMNAENAEKLLLNGQYFNRQADTFIGFDQATFDHLYKTRADRTESFIRAVPTELNNCLLKIVKDIRLQRTNTPYTDGVKIVVNTYPYMFTDDCKEELGLTIFTRLQGLAPVTVSYIEPSELTPEYCKNAFSLMFIYDYNEWLELHSKLMASSLKQRMVEIVLFSPRLLPSKSVLGPDHAFNPNELDDIMLKLEQAASPLVTMKLLDAKLFSVINLAPAQT